MKFPLGKECKESLKNEMKFVSGVCLPCSSQTYQPISLITFASHLGYFETSRVTLEPLGIFMRDHYAKLLLLVTRAYVQRH